MSRTKDFNEEDIISKAMELFWRQGYKNTSLKDILDATGLLKGSLYNAFKSKENLFLLCLEKYGVRSSSFFYKDGDPKEYITSFFQRLIREGSQKDNTKGCLIMNSCLELADQNVDSAQSAQRLFEAIEMNFERVIGLIVKDSSLDQASIKSNITAAAFSIREISKFKKDKKFLKHIANNALKELDLEI